MMPDELILCPFERAVVGGKGHVLLRSNHEHASQAAEAIRRRSHPGWSRMLDGYSIAPTETGTAKTENTGLARKGEGGKKLQKDGQ
jgi:hypothetical protein